ncbi:hypothetical protein C0J52_00283 [Blattella germanica]|nr:hypothetical protein C0J52_00283 [Blattella germanica]
MPLSLDMKISMAGPFKTLKVPNLTFKALTRLPEVPTDIPEDPLLKSQGIPDIDNLTTEKCTGAVKKFALDFESTVWKTEEQIKEIPVQNIFEDVLDPLERAGASLETTWGLAKSLYLVNKDLMPVKAYMSIHEQARRARASKFNSKPIYEACKEAGVSNELTDEQRRVLNKYTLEGRLNGLELDNVKKTKLKNTLNQIGSEKAKFKAKAEPLYGPWKVTLYPHVYTKFMQYCPDRDLRWNIWQAHTRRASKYSGELSLENSTHLEELRFLSSGLIVLDATLAVMCFLISSMPKLFKNFRPTTALSCHHAPSCFLVMKYHAKKRNANGRIYNEEELKEYFPLQRVLTGLFTLCEQLFGLHIQERPGVTTWHPDVRYFDIMDSDSPEPVAGFYLDPYESKDFWLDVVRKLWDQHLAFPLDPRNSHPCSFMAIMCEEWSAAYYCHLWSRVMAADMYSAFLEAGLNNRDELSAIGRRFRSTFLALGGGCHPGEVFRRFRGRDPSPKALINALGLKEVQVLDVESAKL